MAVTCLQCFDGFVFVVVNGCHGNDDDDVVGLSWCHQSLYR